MISGIKSTVESAQTLLPTFQARTMSAPYENKGVLFSEVLFVCAALPAAEPQRLFESGRACGVSTYLLSVCFPSSKIVSIEFDPQSPDVEVAARNLRDRKNVECLFGDARQLLPELVREGDVVVIDGPKHFRALRLALRLLRHCGPMAVFIHDCFQGSPERDFLSGNPTGAFFSDDEAFVRSFAFLDAPCWELRRGLETVEFSEPYLSHGIRSSYGPTFACLPGNPHLDFRRLQTRLMLAGWRYRLSKSWAKRFRPRC